MRPLFSRMPHLPSWAVRALERIAQDRGITVPALVRWIVLEYLASIGRGEE